MANPNLILLYVKDPAKSAVFYKDLLGREPSASFPTFVSFALEGGFFLGLRSVQTPHLPLSDNGNRAEVGFMLQDAAAVDKLYEDWSKRGIPIVQKPENTNFGRTFVALDPDGHWLRGCMFDK